MAAGGRGSVLAWGVIGCGTIGCGLIGCGSADRAGAGGGWATPFPHVRMNIAQRTIELDGLVPIDPHDKETPEIYLEVVVCSKNSREHETLVVTEARPSDVHAALLLLGLEPGAPGAWGWDRARSKMTVTPPMGPGVRVSFMYRDAGGAQVESDPADWIIDVHGRRSLRELAGIGRAPWVFAGSVIAPRPDGPGEYYKADIEGTLVGLATFGTETLAWPMVFSPEAAVQAPEWIADPAKVPPWKTPVTVRLTAIDGASR